MPSKITGNENRTFRVRSDDEVKTALAKHKGLLTGAALELGYTDRVTLERRLKNNPELKAFQVSCYEERKDTAEVKLNEAIDKGDMQAVQFFLKTQARDRGYGDSLTVTSVNANINYTFDLTKLSVEEVGQLYDFITRCTIEPGNPADYLPDGKESLRTQPILVCENSVESS